MRTRHLFLALPWIALLAGCADDASDDVAASGAYEVAASSLERDLAPDATPSEIGELVAGNTAFALDLYQRIRPGQGNLFFSPHSISLALAMTYAGARGNTETEMASTLHFTLAQDRLHTAFNALDLELATRDDVPETMGEGVQLNIANSSWGQVGHAFEPAYLDVLAVNYGACMRLVDFITASEPARVTINDWVYAETNGKIADLLPDGSIDTWTRLVLVNAIYFKAAWLLPFDEANTADGSFHLVGGGTVTVPMMHQEKEFAYAEGTGYVAVELPYEGNQTSMVLIVPDAGSLGAFEASLDAAQLQAILSALQSTNIELAMPRFGIEAPLPLKSELVAMGMAGAFNPLDADFSGIDGTRDLFISDVLHKAFVDVNEIGTEAAAATAVICGTTSVPPPPVPVTVDRPFVFLVRDVPTGAVLFLGRLTDPSS